MYPWFEVCIHYYGNLSPKDILISIEYSSVNTNSLIILLIYITINERNAQQKYKNQRMLEWNATHTCWYMSSIVGTYDIGSSPVMKRNINELLPTFWAPKTTIWNSVLFSGIFASVDMMNSLTRNIIIVDDDQVINIAWLLSMVIKSLEIYTTNYFSLTFTKIIQ